MNIYTVGETMKKIFLSNIISIISLLVLTFIASLLISIFQYYDILKVNPYVMIIISLLIFLISGMIYGFINKKQGLLGSIVFILVYFIFILIFDVILKTKHQSNLYFLFVILKCLTYMIGSILSVNLKRN